MRLDPIRRAVGGSCAGSRCRMRTAGAVRPARCGSRTAETRHEASRVDARRAPDTFPGAEPPQPTSDPLRASRSGDGSSRRLAGACAHRRGCRSGSSRATRDRAAPGSSAGLRRPRAGASRTHAGGDVGSASGVATSRYRGSGRAPRGRASRSRRVQEPAGHRGGRRRRRSAARSPSGTTRSFPPLPRTCTVSWSKSTSASRSPTTSALRRPQEYVSSRIAPLRSASGPSPATDGDRRLDVGELRRVGEPAPPAGRQGDLRDARGAEREPHVRAHCREATRDRRGSEPSPAATELCGVLRQRLHVDVGHCAARPLQPGAEIREVGCVGAAGRLREPGAGEIPIDRRAHLHPVGFAPSPVLPARCAPHSSSQRSSSSLPSVRSWSCATRSHSSARRPLAERSRSSATR